MCICCGKPSHITRFLYKKNKERGNANITKDEDIFAFAMQHGTNMRSVCKWVMDLRDTKYMIPLRTTFDTY
jgi:hypothetical protein